MRQIGSLARIPALIEKISSARGLNFERDVAIEHLPHERHDSVIVEFGDRQSDTDRGVPLAAADALDLFEGPRGTFVIASDTADLIMDLGGAVDAHRNKDVGPLADCKDLFPVLNAAVGLDAIVWDVDHCNVADLAEGSGHDLFKIFSKVRLAPGETDPHQRFGQSSKDVAKLIAGEFLPEIESLLGINLPDVASLAARVTDVGEADVESVRESLDLTLQNTAYDTMIFQHKLFLAEYVGS